MRGLDTLPSEPLYAANVGSLLCLGMVVLVRRRHGEEGQAACPVSTHISFRTALVGTM
jgi:hypothetical protein